MLYIGVCYVLARSHSFVAVKQIGVIVLMLEIQETALLVIDVQMIQKSLCPA